MMIVDPVTDINWSKSINVVPVPVTCSCTLDSSDYRIVYIFCLCCVVVHIWSCVKRSERVWVRQKQSLVLVERESGALLLLISECEANWCLNLRCIDFGGCGRGSGLDSFVFPTTADRNIPQSASFSPVSLTRFAKVSGLWFVVVVVITELRVRRITSRTLQSLAFLLSLCLSFHRLLWFRKVYTLVL